jgi:hypothetical protein
MRYTIYHPSSNPSRYASYLRVVEESGVDIADTQRVREPNRALHWLPVWEDEGIAERVAKRLRERTEDSEWVVQTLNGQPVSHGPLGPVWIYVGKGDFNFTYGLSPASRQLILKRFPLTKIVEQITVETPDPSDLESKQSHWWRPIVELLTGLNADQLELLGGYLFYIPRSNAIWTPEVQSR